MSGLEVPSLSLDNSLGALFTGILGAAILFGITNAQVFLYFHQRQTDSLCLKTLIFSLWLLDVVHLAFIAHTFYWYAISNYGDIPSLQYMTWSLLAQVIITSTSNLIIRGIFIRRIWRLSRGNHYIVPVIGIPTLVIFGSGIAYAVKAQGVRAFEEYRRLSWMLYLGYACSMVADQSISVLNTLFLWRSRTESKPVDVPNILVIYGVNAGILTSLCSLVIFLTYVAMPGNLISVAFYFLLCKLYFNTLLGSLNARPPKQTTTQQTVAMSPVSGSRPRRSFGLARQPRSPTFNQAATLAPSQIAINIETVTEQKTDSLVRDSNDHDSISKVLRFTSQYAVPEAPPKMVDSLSTESAE